MIPPIQKNCDTRRPSLSSSSMPLWCRSIQDWMAVSTLMVVLVLFGGTVAPPAASAFSASTASSVTVFQNEYQDPQFPKCRRTITVDGTQLEYTGTAIDHGTKDCTPQNIRQYRIEVIKNQGGIVLSEDNDETATIELGALKGVWEPAVVSSSSSDDSLQNVDGIRWSDGNKWVVKRKPMSTTIGEGIFYAYIGLSTLAGVKGVWDGIQRKRQEEKQSS